MEPQLNEMLGTDEEADVDPSRKALVAEWIERVKMAKDDKKTKDAFDRMKENQAFAARGADEKWIANKNYVVPITNRHINLSVSQLYAKNPTAVAKPRRKLMYQLWDGKADSLNMAVENAAMGDPMSVDLVKEVVAALQYKLMLKRMGQTSEILWDYYISEQAYNFKKQLKAMVRRAKVTGVGYVKIGFQRIMEPRPEITAQIEDVTSKIAAIEATLNDLAEDDLSDDSARLEELRLNLRDLQDQQMMVVREGPVFDFPHSNEIIVDTDCRQLSSFAGARFIAHEYDMTAERIEEIYKVDVKSTATKYRTDGKMYTQGRGRADEKCVYKVWEIQDKRNKQFLTVCDGWNDFLKEPAEPSTKIDRFWTVFPLVFNETEQEDEIYSPSDVEQTRHIQMEYNRSREALRQHRVAARPYYVEGGRLEEEEKAKLSNHADHEIITLPSLDSGEDVAKLVQRGPTAPIDPNLYETEMLFSDLMRVVGTQEANLGGVSGGTATESSIAEQSRGASLADNVDDLDELLTELARAFNQVCLLELSKDKVMEIVGPGAVWPEAPQTRQEIAQELMLEIKAGSSGRPNRAAELANLERAMPYMVQLQSVTSTPLAERYAELLDLPVEELVAEGMPSITALNALMSKTAAGMGGQSTGDPSTDPGQQGGQGANNAPGPQQNENEPGPQPAYPEPMAGPPI